MGREGGGLGRRDGVRQSIENGDGDTRRRENMAGDNLIVCPGAAKVEHFGGWPETIRISCRRGRGPKGSFLTVGQAPLFFFFAQS